MKKIILTAALLLIFSASFSEGSKHCYIKVPETFYSAYNGYSDGLNTLFIVRDTAGNPYVSVNALNEFSYLFDNVSLPKPVMLYPNAFPKDTINNF